MRSTSRSSHKRARLGVALAGACALALSPALSAVATGSGPAISLAPNHVISLISAKPGNGGSGGGGNPHGGSGSGSGQTPIYGWASSNWSGYASQDEAKYTSVSATWTVPTVATSKKPTYSATWVGIDGFNDSSLIQTGTEQDYVNGSAQYQAWWTTSANGYIEQVYSKFAVAPGDSITATITSTRSSTKDNCVNTYATDDWELKLTNNDSGNYACSYSAYSGPETSAEWIVEAPTVGGHVATLANYASTSSPLTFTAATVNSGPADLYSVTNSDSEAGIMVQKGTSIVSSPSTPNVGSTNTQGGTAFNMAYGPYAPSAP